MNTVINLNWYLDGWDVYYTHIFLSTYHGIELSYEYKMPFTCSRNYGLRSCSYQQWYVCADSCFVINSQNEVCFNQNAIFQAFQVTGVFNHLDNKEPVPISFLFLFCAVVLVTFNICRNGTPTRAVSYQIIVLVNDSELHLSWDSFYDHVFGMLFLLYWNVIEQGILMA